MVPIRQLGAFGVVGAAAAVAHYGCLITLVETLRWQPVPATLVGYIAGGIVSYAANRALTFTTDRAHRSALVRFVIVAGVGFGLTWLVMAVLVGVLGAPYLPAQILTTGCVVLWSFVAHKLWTFSEIAPP